MSSSRANNNQTIKVKGKSWRKSYLEGIYEALTHTWESRKAHVCIELCTCSESISIWHKWISACERKDLDSHLIPHKKMNKKMQIQKLFKKLD